MHRAQVIWRQIQGNNGIGGLACKFTGALKSVIDKFHKQLLMKCLENVSKKIHAHLQAHAFMWMDVSMNIVYLEQLFKLVCIIFAFK